jgi:hypothetical protein
MDKNRADSSRVEQAHARAAAGDHGAGTGAHASGATGDYRQSFVRLNLSSVGFNFYGPSGPSGHGFLKISADSDREVKLPSMLEKNRRGSMSERQRAGRKPLLPGNHKQRLSVRLDAGQMSIVKRLATATGATPSAVMRQVFNAGIRDLEIRRVLGRVN